MADSETKRFALDFGSDTLQIFDKEGVDYRSASLGRNESPSFYIHQNNFKFQKISIDNNTEFYKNIKYLVALDPKIPIFKGQMTPLVAGAIMLKKIIESVVIFGCGSKNIVEKDSTFVFTMTLSPEEQQIFKEMFKIAFPNSKIKIINEGTTQTLELNSKFVGEKKFYQINLDIGGSTNFLTFSKVERKGEKIDNNIEQKVYMIPSGGKKIDKYLSEFILDVVLPIEYYVIKKCRNKDLTKVKKNFKEIYEDYISLMGSDIISASKKERHEFENKKIGGNDVIIKIIEARKEFNEELNKILDDKKKIKQFNRQMSEGAKKFKEIDFSTFNFLTIDALSKIFDTKYYNYNIFSLDCTSTNFKEQLTEHFFKELEEVTEKILPPELDKNTNLYFTCTGGTALIKDFKNKFFNNVKEIIEKRGYESKKITNATGWLNAFEDQAKSAARYLDDETFKKMKITPMGHQRYIIVVNGKIVNYTDGEEIPLEKTDKVDIYLPFEQLKKDEIVPVFQQTLGNSITYERKEGTTLEKIEKMIEEEEKKEEGEKKLEVLKKLKQDLEEYRDIHTDEGMLAILRAKALMGKVKAFHYKNLENIKVQNNGEEFGIFVKKENKERENITEKLDEDFLNKSKEEFDNFMEAIKASDIAYSLQNNIEAIFMFFDKRDIYKQYEEILNLAEEDDKILTARQTRELTNYCIENSFFYKYMNCVYTFFNKVDKEKKESLKNSFNSFLESFFEIVKKEKFFSVYEKKRGVNEECFDKIMELDKKFREEFNNKKEEIEKIFTKELKNSLKKIEKEFNEDNSEKFKNKFKSYKEKYKQATEYIQEKEKEGNEFRIKFEEKKEKAIEENYEHLYKQFFSEESKEEQKELKEEKQGKGREEEQEEESKQVVEVEEEKKQEEGREEEQEEGREEEQEELKEEEQEEEQEEAVVEEEQQEEGRKDSTSSLVSSKNDSTTESAENSFNLRQEPKTQKKSEEESKEERLKQKEHKENEEDTEIAFKQVIEYFEKLTTKIKSAESEKPAEKPAEKPTEKSTELLLSLYNKKNGEAITKDDEKTECEVYYMSFLPRDEFIRNFKKQIKSTKSEKEEDKEEKLSEEEKKFIRTAKIFEITKEKIIESAVEEESKKEKTEKEKTEEEKTEEEETRKAALEEAFKISQIIAENYFENGTIEYNSKSEEKEEAEKEQDKKEEDKKIKEEALKIFSSEEFNSIDPKENEAGACMCDVLYNDSNMPNNKELTIILTNPKGVVVKFTLKGSLSVDNLIENEIREKGLAEVIRTYDPGKDGIVASLCRYDKKLDKSKNKEAYNFVLPQIEIALSSEKNKSHGK